MTKAVFRPNELVAGEQIFILDPPNAFPELSSVPPVEGEEDEDTPVIEDVYTGPTADDLRQEAESFRIQWEVERDAMIRSAKMEADTIIKKAEEAAFHEVKRKSDEAQIIKQQAEMEAENIIQAAQQKTRELEAVTRAGFDKERKDAEERGYVEGREQGYVEGKAEVERLIQRTQVVLERAQDKRMEILTETEQQIVDLVLLLTRKVVKVISETQRGVVISNVVQALRKIKGRGPVIIRVNMADIKLTTEHTKDFIKLVENAASIQIQEDSKVDQGGCIIETDFGEIDARISSQLAELESNVLELSPIKTKPAKTDAARTQTGNTEAAKADASK